MNDKTVYDVIDIGEIAAHIAVVEHLDRLTGEEQQLGVARGLDHDLALRDQAVGALGVAQHPLRGQQRPPVRARAEGKRPEAG